MSTDYKRQLPECRKYIKKELGAVSVISKPYREWERLLSYNHFRIFNWSILEAMQKTTQMRIGDIEVTPNGVVKIWWWRKR